MSWSWISTSFLALCVISLVSVSLVKDRRLHIGAFTLVMAWGFSWFFAYFAGFRAPLLTEILLNAVVFYVFLQLHFWTDGEKNGPVWPVYIMLLELCIGLSHITKVTFGPIHYIAIVNVLFTAELVIVICVALYKKFWPKR